MRSALVVVVALVVGTGCKKSHEEAVKATMEQCVKFLAAADSHASCDHLAALTEDVAAPFGDVRNDKELSPGDDEFLTKCMDSIAEHSEDCKDNTAYKKAMDKLMYAVTK
ncbi:hypothetical protein BH11MYX3_BH11MYX3_46790 [soil metagenome]